MAVRILRVIALVSILAGLAGSLYFALPDYRLPPGGSGELGRIRHLPPYASVLVAGAALLLLLRSVPASGPRSASVAWWFSLPTLLTGLGGAACSGLFVVIVEVDRRRRAAYGFDDSPAGAAMMAVLAGSLALVFTGALFFCLSLWLRRRKPTPVV